MIEVQSVKKTINGKEILHDISFKINSAEIIAYVGPNGAGKTTTFNILSTLIKPSSVSVLINGLDIIQESKEIRKIIGYVFEDTGLYPGLTVSKNLDFIARLYKIPNPLKKRKIRDFIESQRV